MGGHCLCGAVRFRYDPDRVNWRGYCHCASCRRNCAAPVTAFFGVANGGWAWIGAEPGQYQSSDHAMRFFCKTCGTPMAYASTQYPDELHFYATLDDPNDFTPEQHFHWSERLSWLALSDELPRKG